MITDKQRHVYHTMIELERTGTYPCIQEVADAIGKSWSTARYHIECLAKAGWITRTPAKDRSMRVVY